MKKTLEELQNEYAGREDELLELLYGMVAAREKMLIETENVMIALVTAQCNFRGKVSHLHDKAYELEHKITEVTGDFGETDDIMEVAEDEYCVDEFKEKKAKDSIEKKPSLDEIRFGRVDCCGCCEQCKYRNNTVCLIDKRLGSEKPSAAQVKYAERIASVLNIGLPICKRMKSYHKFIALNVDEFNRQNGMVIS